MNISVIFIRLLFFGIAKIITRRLKKLKKVNYSCFWNSLLIKSNNRTKKLKKRPLIRTKFIKKKYFHPILYSQSLRWDLLVYCWIDHNHLLSIWPNKSSVLIWTGWWLNNSNCTTGWRLKNNWSVGSWG
jgi:hypothetical protein